MWNRFWLLISTLWALFCIHGFDVDNRYGYRPLWLVLGSAGFVLWMMGHWVKNAFGKRG